MNVVVRHVGFDALTSREAYALWRLRQDVFVVEQHSPYPDLDGRDLAADTTHVLLEVDGTLAGCARVLTEPGRFRVGRVTLSAQVRGGGHGRALVAAALAACGDAPVVLDAQTYLVDFYSSFGFVVDGEEFDEDGVLHVPMVRAAG